jgi:hypothetical protein
MARENAAFTGIHRQVLEGAAAMPTVVYKRTHDNDIAGKLNWTGVGAHRTFVKGMRDPIVTFDRFRDFGTAEPALRVIAPLTFNGLFRPSRTAGKLKCLN